MLSTTYTRARGWLFAAMTTVVAAACGGETDEAMRIARIYDLVTALPRATVQAPAPEFVVGREELIGSEQRRVIFMHAASSAEFPPVAVDARSALVFAIAVQDEAWDKGGDGVEFTVSLTAGNSPPVTAYSRYIDPKHNEAERGWIDVRVSLAALAGQSVRITLSTTPGPAGDNDSDWAVWGSPEVVIGE